MHPVFQDQGESVPGENAVDRDVSRYLRREYLVPPVMMPAPHIPHSWQKRIYSICYIPHVDSHQGWIGMLSEELRVVLDAEQEAVARVRKAQADAEALIFSAEEEGRQLVLEAQLRAAEEVARYRDSEVARAKDEADNTIRAAEREAGSLKSVQQARVDAASGLIVSAVTGERDVLPG